MLKAISYRLMAPQSDGLASSLLVLTKYLKINNELSSEIIIAAYLALIGVMGKSSQSGLCQMTKPCFDLRWRELADVEID